MTSQPPRPRPGDGYASSLIVQAAIEALEAGHGRELTHREAKQLLPQWSGYGELTGPEREAVLARFPHECHDVGWTSGPC